MCSIALTAEELAHADIAAEGDVDALLESLSMGNPDGAVVDAVATLAPGALTAQQRIEALRLVHEHIAHSYAVAARFVAAIGRNPAPEDWAREEIALGVNVSLYAADKMLTAARALQDRLPSATRALEAGLISWPHVLRLVEGTKDLADDVARRVEVSLIKEAETETPATFARTVARAVAKADPVGAEVRHTAAAAERSAVRYPAPDGMGVLVTTLPAPDLQTIWTAMDTLAAKRAADDPRSVDAARVDALVEMARRALADPSAPKPQGRRAQVNVTMSVATALCLSEDPAELLGYGPIPAGVARELAASAEWRAFVTDAATGILARIGTERYRPTQELRDLTVARDQVCLFPNCNMPAERCDIDHDVPHRQGGPTDSHNCGMLCRRHHRLKTLTGWALVRHPDGTCSWTSPHGLVYSTGPPRYDDAQHVA